MVSRIFSDIPVSHASSVNHPLFLPIRLYFWWYDMVWLPFVYTLLRSIISIFIVVLHNWRASILSCVYISGHGFFFWYHKHTNVSPVYHPSTKPNTHVRQFRISHRIGYIHPTPPCIAPTPNGIIIQHIVHFLDINVNLRDPDDSITPPNSDGYGQLW